MAARQFKSGNRITFQASRNRGQKAHAGIAVIVEKPAW
jgi:hypothetical protein